MLNTNRCKRCGQLWSLQEIQRIWTHCNWMQQWRVTHAWIVLHESRSTRAKGFHLYVAMLGIFSRKWCISISWLINYEFFRGWTLETRHSALCVCSRYWYVETSPLALNLSAILLSFDVLLFKVWLVYAIGESMKTVTTGKNAIVHTMHAMDPIKIKYRQSLLCSVQFSRFVWSQLPRGIRSTYIRNQIV